MAEISFNSCLTELKKTLDYVEDDSFKWDDSLAILVIPLSNTDSLNKERDVSNATQIQLTGESVPVEGSCKTEDFFPTLTLNTTFERWRIGVPTRINAQNVMRLSGKTLTGEAWLQDSIQIRRRLLNKTATKPGNPTLQICYGEDLMPLRKQLKVGDYLVVVKRKGATEYEAFGVRSDAELGTVKRMYVSEKANTEGISFNLEELKKRDDGSEWIIKPADIDLSTSYSIEELGALLKDMYTNAPEGMQVCSIHAFGIKYGKAIVANGYKSPAIIKAAGINDSYYTELTKAINLYKSLIANTFGLSLVDVAAKPGKASADRKTGAENVLLYGVPGAGKSHMIKTVYCNDRTKMERVVFHPDYTYSDFVGQILPKVVDGQLKYEFTPGPFTTILKKALDDPSNYYYLVVEEINRGNAPAIFGEIFQLLDRKAAGEYPDEEIGESEYGITNFDIAKAVYDDESQDVFLPSNLWILATMNTADQNVFTLDTAFQRRWIMKHIENNVLQAKHASTLIAGSTIDWGTFASVVNDLVLEANAEISSSEDKRLGAYFIGMRELQADRFPEKVLKYLWDDAFKMSRDFIFNDDMKSLEFVIETYQKSTTDRLQSVLRADVYNKMISSMNAKKSAATPGVDAVDPAEASGEES
ncbi:McrB family protein [Allofournierella massiliensis]|uniref:AAA family ATPase n=1 Tax=Allofournierella massiliensis TaxID=1650663 RepID=A0ABT7UU18_9FIRM|nr:AAA family ATPase [Fournierella massiliensis]MDM8202384.1 AAA family ATPase [Fournierella massiliensis]